MPLLFSSSGVAVNNCYLVRSMAIPRIIIIRTISASILSTEVFLLGKDIYLSFIGSPEGYIHLCGV
tara:strand:+ start:412 stop:609 length:198 start_codon:yes stop_codon:yes gene_type:complete